MAALTWSGTDDEWIKKIESIQDANELLNEWSAARFMLSDPYYRDLVDVLVQATDKIIKADNT